MNRASLVRTFADMPDLEFELVYYDTFLLLQQLGIVPALDAEQAGLAAGLVEDGIV